MASNTSINHCLESFQKFPQSPIIDLRNSNDFSSGHWSGSSHFAVKKLISRMFELPKRNQALRLLGSLQQITTAKQLLIDKGYQVDALIEWSLALEKYLETQKLIEQGAYSIRLWSPAPIVKKFQNDYLDLKQMGAAIDIGCGAGRDSVYLATQGWQVNAVDYLPDALEKVKQLALNNRVSVNCSLLDLEKDLDCFIQQSDKYQLVLVSRYLHRPLLPVLRDKITSGGYIVYQTFMQGCERFGSPKNPRFLLRKGELAEIFNDFNVLLDQTEFLFDGRPTNVFIAQKIT